MGNAENRSVSFCLNSFSSKFLFDFEDLAFIHVLYLSLSETGVEGMMRLL